MVDSRGPLPSGASSPPPTPTVRDPSHALPADQANVYVAWVRFPFPGSLFGYGNTTAFARSTDGGLTWQAPNELSAEFLTQDLILGNDRSNTSPSMAVDRTNGAHSGSIYVVHTNNNTVDGADIVFQKRTDGGLTFSPAIVLNSRPGQDRARGFLGLPLTIRPDACRCSITTRALRPAVT